jgi:two-component system, chemotaxis family, protein-glutamate methylesterase/glutaminase
MLPTSGHSGDGVRGVVAVGASAGGVEALSDFAAGLPADLPYAVLIALHIPPNAPSVLASIIDRSGPLPAFSATDGDKLEAGKILVAVPDRHIMIDDHRVVLAEGPKENGHRPAINALFRSVALSSGRTAIAVVLSGVLDDGVAGAAAVKARGGITVAQRPTDAVFPAMPQNAIDAGVIDHQAAATEIGALLAQLADREFEERVMEPDARLELENRIAMGSKFSLQFDTESLGPHSGNICPDCGGSLMVTTQNSFRCRVGHAWTGEALLQARDDEVEQAIWIALRSLQEKARLARKMADNVGPGVLGRRYSEAADEAEHAMSVIGDRLSGSGAGHIIRSAGERRDE